VGRRRHNAGPAAIAPVTADTALRLARYFGTTPGFWMNIQAQYDLERATDELADDLRKIDPLKHEAV